MSAEVACRVLESNECTSPWDLLVLLELAWHADKNGENSWPSVARICERTGLGRRRVFYALRNLEQSGQVKRTGFGPAGTVRYSISSGAPDARVHDMHGVHQMHTKRGAPHAPELKPLTGKRKDRTLPLTPKPRKRDELWDVLAAELGEPETRSERGRRNAALKELREIGATPLDLKARISAYRKDWPDITLTANALVANWTTLANGVNGHRLAPGDAGFVPLTAADTAAHKAILQARRNGQ